MDPGDEQKDHGPRAYMNPQGELVVTYCGQAWSMSRQEGRRLVGAIEEALRAGEPERDMAEWLREQFGEATK